MIQYIPILLLLAASQTYAIPYQTDILFGEALTGNSGSETERQGLADILNVALEEVVEDTRNDSPTAMVNDADSWYLDVDPDTPGYFGLKFGTGGLPVTADTFYFENIEDLTKLVWENSQVQGITGDPDCNNCNIGRLSHYTLLTADSGGGDDEGDGGNDDVDITLPTPAPLALLGLGLVGMIGARRFMR